MGKEKIKKIFSLLENKPIASGKTIQFSKSELSQIKSFCFSSEKPKTKKKSAKKITSSKRAIMLKNLEKARRARKAKSKKKQSKKGK